jgi:hypothetical protein
MLPPELLIYLLVNKSAREGTKDLNAILDELTAAMMRARSRPVADAAKQFQAWYARRVHRLRPRRTHPAQLVASRAARTEAPLPGMRCARQGGRVD